MNDIPEFIHCDERQLKQILYNLLSNAVKFTPNGGDIDLAAKCDYKDDSLGQEDHDHINKYVRISVKDSGIGLRKEDLERVFKPFEQVESSASRRFDGTGLGLSLVKHFVQLHGGNIWVESDGVGAGATFHFMLPV